MLEGLSQSVPRKFRKLRGNHAAVYQMRVKYSRLAFNPSQQQIIYRGFPEMQIDEGQQVTALNNKKLKYTVEIPRNLGNKQPKIQTRKLFLFPATQETVDAAVLLEIMKIRQSKLSIGNP